MPPFVCLYLSVCQRKAFHREPAKFYALFCNPYGNIRLPHHTTYWQYWWCQLQSHLVCYISIVLYAGHVLAPFSLLYLLPHNWVADDNCRWPTHLHRTDLHLQPNCKCCPTQPKLRLFPLPIASCHYYIFPTSSAIRRFGMLVAKCRTRMLCLVT